MREIELSRGMVALVDDDDYERVVAAGPWHAVPSGRTHYAQHALGGGKSLRMHLFITGLAYVDHRNGDGLDNQRSNLRAATHALNMGNQRRSKSNTSGFKGVTRKKNWVAQIRVNGQQRHIGTYPTAEEAARAYDREAIAAWGEYARLNFPAVAA